MNKKCILSAILISLFTGIASAGQINCDIMEDASITDLESSIQWAQTHSPTRSEHLNEFGFENLGVKNDDCVIRVWGWLTPPVAGEYTFWISSRHQSGFWISNSYNPVTPNAATANCKVLGWSPYRNWDYPSAAGPYQRSNPIYLEQGEKYYIVAIVHANQLSVGWAGPTIGSVTTPTVVVISGDYLSAYPPNSDCNSNGIPDESDIAQGTSKDCNVNGKPDECDISEGISQDCNANGIPDQCDISAGTSLDCNGNGIPDECDLDCNGNDIPDDCDISQGTSQDCNGNGIPDECDISQGTSQDCNGNGIPDECEADCNGNGIPDDCDITHGTSQDLDSDGVPDECEVVTGQNIGSPTPGGFEVQDGVYTVRGNGDDIWNQRDNFFFVYLPISGDCEFSARVASITGGTSEWRKSGVMIRETLTAGSTHASMYVIGGYGRDFQWRASTGGYPYSTGEDNAALAPYWVRVKREGNIFTGYKSVDGITWVRHGSATIAMVNNIYIGLAVTSHEAGILTTAVFDHITVRRLNDIARGPIPNAWFINVKVASILEWSDPHDYPNATFDLYLGTHDPAQGGVLQKKVSKQDVNSYDPGTLAFGTTYFWRVDTYDTLGVAHTGDIWRFTTAPDCNGNGIEDFLDLSNGTSLDCNGNGISDECDILQGISQDCNGNGIPDECDTDCNGNGIPDECDILQGISQDCNENGIPDECDTDCNRNGIPDDCDITQGTSQDRNGDGIPDECGILSGKINRDIWDNASVQNLAGAIAWINTHSSTTSDLLNYFDFPDRGKGYYVARVWGWLKPPATGDYTFWIASDDDSGLWLSPDITAVTPNAATAICQVTGWTNYQNWYAQTRQKSNPVHLEQSSFYSVLAIMREEGGGDYLSVAWAGPGIGDSPTVIQGQYLWTIPPYFDCNNNNINDYDEIRLGTSQDCNGNGIPDECDLSQGTSHDCNGNGTPDECDISNGSSKDLNGDGIPDECQLDVRVEPVVTLVDPAGTSEVRTQLPESITAVVRGGRYFVEIWASDVGAVNTGLTGVYVDAAFCGQTRATELNNGTIFTEFTSGTIQSGKVDEFGGSALPSGGGIGPEWVRIGWLTMSADVDIQTCTIQLQASSIGIAAFNRGLVNWAFVQLGSRAIQILPPARSYDLDGDNTIGVGDLSLFAGSWQKSVPPAAGAHDFDCDNFVGVGDLSWFATGWLKVTNNPTILYPACTPPPANMPGVIPPPLASEDVLFGLALRETQSSKDTATNLPDSVEAIVPDGTYYLEVWASDAGDINTGLTSAYVDLEITPEAVTVANVGHGGIFTQFKGGTVGPTGIDNLGGSSLNQGVGVEPMWARVAVVRMTALSRNVTFALTPGAWGTAAYGRGAILWDKIALGSLEYISFRPWDLNQDMRIDLGDFAIMSENWLYVGDQIPGDFDRNGSVTIEDMAAFVNHWLEE